MLSGHLGCVADIRPPETGLAVLPCMAVADHGCDSVLNPGDCAEGWRGALRSRVSISL